MIIAMTTMTDIEQGRLKVVEREGIEPSYLKRLS